jgi:hypothetical protein
MCSKLLIFQLAWDKEVQSLISLIGAIIPICLIIDQSM